MMYNLNKFITKEELEELNFNEEEIQNLIISGLLKENMGKYVFKSEFHFIYYARQLKYITKLNFSYKCIRLAYYINPQNYDTNFEMFYNSIIREDYESTIEPLRYLLNNASEEDLTNYKTYLYILSIITPMSLPADLKECALKLSKNDLLNENLINGVDINKIIYAQKWNIASQLLKNSSKYRHKTPDEVLKITLLDSANNVQLMSKQHIEELLINDDYEGALGYLERQRKIHQISLIETFTCKVLKDLLRLTYSNILPQKVKPQTDNPNVYDAISACDYEKALEVADSYSRINNNILYRSIKAIVKSIETYKEDKDTIVEKEQKLDEFIKLLLKGINLKTIYFVLNIPNQHKYIILLETSLKLYEQNHIETADKLFDLVNNLPYKSDFLSSALEKVSQKRESVHQKSLHKI